MTAPASNQAATSGPPVPAVEPSGAKGAAMLLLAVAVTLPGLVATPAFREAPVAPMIDEETAERRNTSALATILGEFRASTADMIFIKTERYLDSGVGYAPHLDMAAMSGSGQIQTKSGAPAALAAAAPNPPHGQPGHRHDHGDEDNAGTTETAATTGTAHAPNPPHGQPGHRHDHGDEDDAETTTTTPVEAATDANPPHGQPGHRHEEGDDAPGHEGHGHKHAHAHGHSHGDETEDAPTTGPDTAERVIARAEGRLASGEMKETAAIKPGETLTEDHGGDPPATLIRTRDRDFRGFIGELERRVKPWRDPSDPHKHTAGTELLPWYRLATLTDPHNVRCYMIGAWWLKNLPKGPQPEEALAFLEEGIANNPQAFQLPLMQSYLHSQLKRPEKAMEKALRAAALALAKRPPWGADAPGWNHYTEDDATGAVTMAIVLTRDTKGEAAGKELAARFDREAGGTMPIAKRLAGLKADEGFQPKTPKPETPTAVSAAGAAGQPGK